MGTFSVRQSLRISRRQYPSVVATAPTPNAAAVAPVAPVAPVPATTCLDTFHSEFVAIVV